MCKEEIFISERSVALIIRILPAFRADPVVGAVLLEAELSKADSMARIDASLVYHEYVTGRLMEKKGQLSS